MAEDEDLDHDVFSILPPPTIIDILSRLSVETILQVQSVCKAWLELISEPEFARLHLSRSPSCLIVNNLGFDAPEYPDSGYFSLFEVENEPDYHGLRHIARLKFVTPKSNPPLCVNMIGSVDGLVCIVGQSYGCTYESIYVWNPTLREFITLPTPPGDILTETPRGRFSVPVYGFGTSSGNYHVAKFNQLITEPTCHVYTIGAGSDQNKICISTANKLTSSTSK